jgi:hypothetical protein
MRFKYVLCSNIIIVLSYRIISSLKQQIELVSSRLHKAKCMLKEFCAAESTSESESGKCFDNDGLPSFIDQLDSEIHQCQLRIQELNLPFYTAATKSKK